MERYESDVEDEGGEGGKTKVGGGRDQVLLRISERFLDEIDTDGKVCASTLGCVCYCMYL